MKSYRVVELAHRIASDVEEYGEPSDKDPQPDGGRVSPDDPLLADYDYRITDDDVRAATRSRFVSKHYSDAVEAAVKTLNECVRARTGLTLDGDGLMTVVFSPKAPLLRINRLRSDSEKSEQRGHMMMCQGVVAAWRNPRAHTSQFEDTAGNVIMMLEHVQYLMSVTKAATRVRRRRVPR